LIYDRSEKLISQYGDYMLPGFKPQPFQVTRQSGSTNNIKLLIFACSVVYLMLLIQSLAATRDKAVAFHFKPVTAHF